MKKYILLIISLITLLSSIFIIDNLSEYRKKRNIEVAIIEKIQLQIPDKNRLDSYLIAQALSEVKDEAVNLTDHSFVRNNKTMNNDGSIKSYFFTKKWTNGPKFKIKVDLTTYMMATVGTRSVFKLRYKDIKKDQSKEDLIIISIILLSMSIVLLIISLFKILSPYR